MMNSETNWNFMPRSVGGAVLIAAFALGPLWASDIRREGPEQVGFSSTRLDRVDKVFGGFVAEGKLGGAVTLICRRGTVVHHAAFGRLNEQQAMRDDAVFAIDSSLSYTRQSSTEVHVVLAVRPQTKTGCAAV